MALVDSNQIIQLFNQISLMPIVRQLGLLVGLAASVALGVGIVFWSQAPDYSPLYSDLTAKNAAQVIATLEQLGIPYQLDNRTGMIMAPSGKVPELRLKLASQGLPGGDNKGFAMLDKEQQLGTSSFMEIARYNRALEEELTKSITSLESVASARVHLAIPKQSAFIRKSSKPNASVLVNLYPGRELSEAQLAGIVYLVAASVADLEPEGVTLVDQKGRLLSGQSGSKDLLVSSQQFRFTQKIEEHYISRIVDILSPIVGSDGIRVQVVADLDFTAIERTKEIFDPDRSAVRSEQTVVEGSSAANSAATEDQLGNQSRLQTLSQPDENSATIGQMTSSGSTRRATRNYELDRTVSHIREAPGSVRRLSVAVVVDFRKEKRKKGVTQRVPLSAEEMSQITSLAREAMGFNAQRGDSLQVINTPFKAPEKIRDIPRSPFWEQDWLKQLAKQLMGFVGVLVIILGVLRPAIKMLVANSTKGLPPTQSLSPARGLGHNGIHIGDDQVTLGGQPAFSQLPDSEYTTPNYDQQLNIAKSMVQEDPARVAHVLKGWVAADG